MNNRRRRFNLSPISALVFCFGFSFAAVATVAPQRASAQMQTGWEHFADCRRELAMPQLHDEPLSVSHEIAPDLAGPTNTPK
jgi:hypothetical protein